MYDKNTDARRQAYKEYSNDRIPEDALNSQNVFTPYDLCYDIIRKLESKTDLIDKDILIFNLEFAEILIHDFGVSPERIAFWTDCDEKRKFAQLMYRGIKHHRVEFNKESIDIMTKNAKDIEAKDKFDVVIGNPPYQPGAANQKNRGKTIWDKFVKLSLELIKENGHLCFVHPSKWRCPKSDLHNLLFVDNQIKFLSIHGDTDGKKTFNGASTRYDWYVLEKKRNKDKTNVRFENDDICHISMSSLPFLPNFAFSIWGKTILLSKEYGGIKSIRDQRFNIAAKPNLVSRIKSELHKYPLVKSVNKNGVDCCWSIEKHPVQNKSKIIFSNARHVYPIFDNELYGVCEGAIYIAIKKEEADIYLNFLKSKLMKVFIQSTKWNNFRTDDRIFEHIPNPVSIGITAKDSDKDIYKLFKLTKKEIKYIENLV